MAIVSLAGAKAWCRIDFNDDDALLERLMEAAEAHIEQNLGYTFAEKFPDNDVPEDLKDAVLQLLAQRYEYREASLADAPTEMPMGVWDVIRERRRYSF
jgi:uncharacterized phage protein (predicted DNA packaging)